MRRMMSSVRVTYEYVPGESNGDEPRYMLPKLKALLSLSVVKYRAHRPYSDPKGCKAHRLRSSLGRRSEKSDGKGWFRTRL